ncbi:MAG: superinfection immunity protein [Clostridia bacterium]|nr:superinfection immunity protein [Clostridia bacterium]
MAALGYIVLIFYLFAFALYFLPSIIALAKRNRRTKVILFNIFLGWTVVMWIISLVWACKREEPEYQYPQPPYYG